MNATSCMLYTWLVCEDSTAEYVVDSSSTRSDCTDWHHDSTNALVTPLATISFARPHSATTNGNASTTVRLRICDSWRMFW